MKHRYVRLICAKMTISTNYRFWARNRSRSTFAKQESVRRITYLIYSKITTLSLLKCSAERSAIKLVSRRAMCVGCHTGLIALRFNTRRGCTQTHEPLVARLGTAGTRSRDLNIDGRPAREPIGRRVVVGGDVAWSSVTSRAPVAIDNLKLARATLARISRWRRCTGDRWYVRALRSRHEDSPFPSSPSPSRQPNREIRWMDCVRDRKINGNALSVEFKDVVLAPFYLNGEFYQESRDIFAAGIFIDGERDLSCVKKINRFSRNVARLGLYTES